MRSFVLVLLVLAACSGNKTPAPTSPPPAPAAPHASCSADADCVIVQTACCDHCNGGKAEAFNVAFADQHKPTGCANSTCTDRGCGPAIAKCEAGTCTATIGPLE